MRKEIDRYLVEHMTPLQLAVRIRSHPKMRVTAPAKMSSSVKAAASYGGQLVETRYFRCAPSKDGAAAKVQAFHDANAEAVAAVLTAAAVEGAEDQNVKGHRLLLRGVPSKTILQFVEAYEFDPRSTEYSGDLVTSYVRKRMAQGGLQRWNVGVIGNNRKGAKAVALPDGRSVGAVNRTRTNASRKDEVADIKTLTGSRDPGLDLSFTSGPDVTVNRDLLTKLRSTQQPETGLLLLYPIDGQSSADGKDDRADLDAPVDVLWGAALTFPKPMSGEDVLVEYDYVQADLSKVFVGAEEDPDQEDLAVLDVDQDSDTGATV